jgi:OmpA-OmpF porin, OOP family
VIVTTALVAALLATGGYTDRDSAPEPSAKRIEQSVDTYSTKGSVETLAATTTDADESTLTLGTDVLFAFDSADLDARAESAVTAQLADVPKKAKVDVGGHTDSRGGDAVNLPLSKARAEAVADLVSAQRPDLRLTVHGYGSSQPLADETVGGTPDYEAMAQNRRVELSWQG